MIFQFFKLGKFKDEQLIGLWRHLSPRRQKQFYLILVLMIITSLSEVISIGAVLPFIGIMTSPEQIYGHQRSQL